MDPPTPSPFDEPLPIPIEQDARARLPGVDEAVDESWLPATAVFSAVALALSLAASIALVVSGADLGSPLGIAGVLLAGWSPTFGRLAARWTVDRGRPAPLALIPRRLPSPATVALPLLLALGVYVGAYGVAVLAGLARWTGGGAGAFAGGTPEGTALLLALPLAIGNELGWRGWLQPRLDDAGVRGSLPIVLLLEWLTQLPLLFALGAMSGVGAPAGLLLFFGLTLGTAPVRAWVTYRGGSVWAAVWFAAFHYAIARSALPALFVAGGDAYWLGEAGLLPVIAYQTLALAVLGLLWARGGSWTEFARWSLRRARGQTGSV